LELLAGLMQESLGPGPVPTTLVAHDGDLFLGTVSVIACDEGGRPHYTPWIAALWVEPEYRRRGIGAALVDKAFGVALAAGTLRVYLLARAHRRPFYEKLGWSVLEADVPEEGMFMLARE
jgi:GNAT superfamily N-acetyltransferase